MSYALRCQYAACLREIAADLEKPVRVEWWRFDGATKSLVAYVPGEMRRPPECDSGGRQRQSAKEV